ncbi:MAG: flagellar type III secretion system protein FliR [candidate division Zixibacteria bacterium]|nr:flagellar type III secretion system protein FliR [Candidatus Tariuqbacter arcticus]
MYYVPYEDFAAAVLILARMTALVVVMPIFGYRTIPVQAKVGLSVLLTIIIFPLAKMGATPISTQPIELIIMFLREIIIGLILGFAATIVFYGVQMAGQIVGIQIGFGIINVIDPVSDVQISLIGQLNYLIALLIFLCLDGHMFLIRALVMSYEYISLGGGGFPAGLVGKMSVMTGAIFDVALRIAAPIMVTLFITDVVLGFMARVAPQMNVFLVGFPLKIVVGLLVITLVISYFPYIFGKLYQLYQEEIVQIIRIIGH